MRTFAEWVSILFHPFLVNLYLILFILCCVPILFYPLSFSFPLAALLLTTTFILPIGSLLALRLLGFVTNFTLYHRSHRTLPLALILIIYIASTLVLYILFPIIGLLKLMILFSGMVAFVMTVNFIYKISLHSFTICGSVGILFSMDTLLKQESLFLPAVYTLFVAGLVMSARLMLKAHTFDEVAAGGAMGFAIGFAGIALFF